jgi:choline kinase
MTRAIILAAGRGSRMGELTADQPKCFARLKGRRLLDYQLAALRGAGIDEIAIVRGYRGECFTEPVHYFENPRWAETNMVQTLACAAAWLAEAPCVVSYSDIVYSAETVHRLVADPAALAIAYDPDWLPLWSKRFAHPLDDAESFNRHADGSLADIGRRVERLEEINGQYVGLLKFTPDSWRAVSTYLSELGPAADKLDMTSLLRAGLARGWRIATVPVAGTWGEVDAASDLAIYETMDWSHVADQ